MKQSKIQAVLTARDWLKDNPVYLDTETTGLDNKAEIVDLAVIDHDGAVLIDTLIKPTVKIEKGASDVHGIRNNDVQHKDGFSELSGDLARVLDKRLVLIYNAEFDLRLIRQTSAYSRVSQVNLSLVTYTTNCVMELYAHFHGDWNNYRGNYKWQSQAKAARQLGLKLPEDLHRAKADAQLCRLILEAMAATQLPDEVDSMYKKGSVLKSRMRTEIAALFIMVCDDGAGGNLDQTETQFRAVVLLDLSKDFTPGEVHNNWNKGGGLWVSTYFSEISK